MNSRALAALALVSALLSTSIAEAGRTVVHRGPRRTVVVHRNRARTTVVVHRGFPIRRTLPLVYVRPARAALLVATPGLYLAPVVFAPRVVAVPGTQMLAWQDTDRFEKDDDWTDTTFPVNERGNSLVFKVDGKMEISFAEVVFENGDAQVVDFNEKTYQNGVFSLLDFKDGRKVSHVRMVARAKSDEATVAMYLAK